MENAHLCPVVGIGVSAGALEALKILFAAVPAGPGLAFIVVPLLDRGHASLMVLLAACTAIAVSETMPESMVESNHVYAIPPNRHLALVDGRFLLEGSVARCIAVLDLFRWALSEDQRGNAICIFLSDTGARGNQGGRAIKAQGG